MNKVIQRHLKPSAADFIFDGVNAAFMIAICICIVYPLYFVLTASFTDPDVVNQGRVLLYPVKPFTGGYERIFAYPPLWRGYWNTLVYTVIGTAISIAVTLPCAYALSRRDMALRRPIMFLFTFTMFFSGGIIPLFLVIQRLGIYNTLWAMVLPGALSVYNLIVCRSFFDTGIPQELLEASRLDGCTDLGFFFRIVLPVSSTIIAVMILFYATAMWNQFMNALMFLADQKNMPLQVIMRNLILINQANTITTSCKYPEVIAAYVDYCFDPEISITLNWGAEGVIYQKGNDGRLHFRLDEQNNIALIEPYKTFTEMRVNSTPTRGSLAVLDEYYDTIVDYTWDAIDLLEGQIAGGKYDILNEYTPVPKMILTSEEQTNISRIQSTISDIVQRYTIQWVLDGNADAAWTNYLGDLRAAGVNDLVLTFQGAYDRFLEAR